LRVCASHSARPTPTTTSNVCCRDWRSWVNMARRPFTCFVTGTDTGVGKTLVTSALLQAAQSQGLSTIGLKPVAAGCEETAEGLRNDDAMLLQQYTSIPLAYEQINPVSLKQAIAPHIAAALEQRRVDASRLE